MVVMDRATRKAHLELLEVLAHKMPGVGYAIAAEFSLLERVIGTLEAKVIALEGRVKTLEEQHG